MRKKIIGLSVSLLIVFSIGASTITSSSEAPCSGDYIAASPSIEAEYEIIGSPAENARLVHTCELAEMIGHELFETLNIDEGYVVYRTPSRSRRVPASELLETLLPRQERENCISLDTMIEELIYLSQIGGYVYIHYFH